MNIELVNHEIEIKKYKEFLDDNQKAFVIFSKEGVGKTSFIQHVSKASTNKQYINVSAKDISMENHATDFYFIKKFINSLNSMFPSKCKKIIELLSKDFPVDVSFSINAFFASINLEPHFKDSTLKRLLINVIKSINKPLYIHVENVEKIDRPSLVFFIRVIKEIDDIFFFFECVDENARICQALNEQFKEYSVNVQYIEIKKLDWKQVRKVFQGLNLYINDKEKDLYNQLDGNIKTLIFNHQIESSKELNLDKDRQFILDFISNCFLGITITEIHYILKEYDRTFLYKFSISKIEKHLNFLQDMGCVFTNERYYYSTDFGVKNTTTIHTKLINSILSNYYFPIIESGNKNNIDIIIKGLRTLIALYVKYHDVRLKNLIPYIEVYLLPLSFNTKIINELYEYIKDYSGTDIIEIKLILIRIYIRLGSFETAYEKLKEIDTHSDLKNVLLATTMVHLYPNDSQTQKFILDSINSSRDAKIVSALYTCLVSLNMRIKSTLELKQYIEDIDFTKMSNIDMHIIRKNLSIYSNNLEAITSLKKSFRFFRNEGYNHLLVATGITLATRYAQSGNLKNAKRVIKLLERDCVLTEEDQAYIDNNLSSIDLLSNMRDETTYERLINTFYFCEDEYSKLLVANNLLIYYTQMNNLNKAKEFVQLIEDIGLNKYKFDEYRHLTILNLIYYYSYVNNSKRNMYIYKLSELYDGCFSSELKKYIGAFLKKEKLQITDKWFFMSQFKFRPAFMGHWIINNFDY